MMIRMMIRMMVPMPIPRMDSSGALGGRYRRRPRKRRAASAPSLHPAPHLRHDQRGQAAPIGGAQNLLLGAEAVGPRDLSQVPLVHRAELLQQDFLALMSVSCEGVEQGASRGRGAGLRIGGMRRGTVERGARRGTG